MSTTVRETTNTMVAPAGCLERDQLGEVFGLLTYLKVAVEDIRDQLASKRKEHYTIEEVADMVGRSAFTVRRWVSEGRLKAERIRGTGARGRLLVCDDELRKLVRTGLGENIPAVTLAN